MELLAGSLGCGNDLVETLVAAQRIPARIQKQIAVCETVRDVATSFKLLERGVALTRPRVNQRQVGQRGPDR